MHWLVVLEIICPKDGGAVTLSACNRENNFVLACPQRGRLVISAIPIILLVPHPPVKSRYLWTMRRHHCTGILILLMRHLMRRTMCHMCLKLRGLGVCVNLGATQNGRLYGFACWLHRSAKEPTSRVAPIVCGAVGKPLSLMVQLHQPSRRSTYLYTRGIKAQVRANIEYYLENARTIRSTHQCRYRRFGGVSSPYIWLKTPGYTPHLGITSIIYSPRNRCRHTRCGLRS